MHLIEFIENLIFALSSFVALSALCWTAFVQSKGFAAGFPADLRTRLNPPVGEGYLGNCVRGVWLNELKFNKHRSIFVLFDKMFSILN
jgi:hypothetical protein